MSPGEDWLCLPLVDVGLEAFETCRSFSSSFETRPLRFGPTNGSEESIPRYPRGEVGGLCEFLLVCLLHGLSTSIEAGLIFPDRARLMEDLAIVIERECVFETEKLVQTSVGTYAIYLRRPDYVLPGYTPAEEYVSMNSL